MKKNTLLHKFKNITHTFTAREGGCSLPPYDSMNLAFHVNDNSWHVDRNHNILADTLGYNKNSLVYMKQIHSNTVHKVDEHDNFHMPRSCDALITDKINIPLMVMAADCSPLLFYDEIQKVIAVAHAGRAGAFQNIATNVVKSFEKDFQSKAKDIYVSVGASIGACCYEVGKEIAQEAKELHLEYAVQSRQKRYYLDVSSILKTQLLACGILEEHIEFSPDCTCCKNDTYFSYRADGITGRFAGVLMLKEE